MVSKSSFNIWLIVLIVFPLVGLLISLTIGHAFAQEPSTAYLNRRVEIWALFYRGMVAAFVVGALVQGAIVYVAWRFRESNKKNKPHTSVEDVHH
ncbi:MAG TPA: heme transporter CcmC [Nitrososphaeraceae archaeon]|jgi:heme/copper-type cytochrome/quinol oxidase subunit 2